MLVLGLVAGIYSPAAPRAGIMLTLCSALLLLMQAKVQAYQLIFWHRDSSPEDPRRLRGSS